MQLDSVYKRQIVPRNCGTAGELGRGPERDDLVLRCVSSAVRRKSGEVAYTP